MSIGTTIGSAIGTSAAYAWHATCRTATITGEFGQDVVQGATTSYTTKSQELAARRAAAAQAYLATKPQAVVIATPRKRATA